VRRPTPVRPNVWSVRIVVPERAAPAFENAIESFVDSINLSPVDLDAEPGAGGPLILVGHSLKPPPRPQLEAAIGLASAATGTDVPAVTVEKLPPIDWLAASLRSFPPIDAGRFQLRGSHIAEPPLPGRITLVVDAGAAFGSGEHASTKGCLLSLDRLLKRRRFANILDMGCGSGVLALAAVKARPAPGSVHALAVDIDESAARIAGTNARRNGVHARVRTGASDGYKSRLVRSRAPYDLVFANILARPLVRMAAPLARNLAPGGVAILSGLLNRQERMVLAAHRSRGLVLLQRTRLDGWSALVVGRRPI
jgi:ribosomal protein L11 methyltransferase